MNFVKYTECPVSINGDNIFALNASLNAASQVVANITQGGNLEDYSPTAGLGAGVNFDYYVTGLEDGIASLTGDIACSGEFGGIKFSGAYLQDYSVKIKPYVPVEFSAKFVIYSGYSQELETGSFEANEINIANGAKTSLTNITQANIGLDNPVSIEYAVHCDRDANYTIGGEFPSDVRFGKVTKQLSIDGENIGSLISYSGKDFAGISISPKNINNISRGQTLDCSGIISAQTLSVEAGGIVNGNIEIMESTR